jgi:hypothetical protein
MAGNMDYDISWADITKIRTSKITSQRSVWSMDGYIGEILCVKYFPLEFYDREYIRCTFILSSVTDFSYHYNH